MPGCHSLSTNEQPIHFKIMRSIDLKTLRGAAIRRKRSILGISQGELAKRSGLHRTYVSDLERGARNPSIQSIEKLADALQVSISKLFATEGDGSSANNPVEI